MTPTQKTLLRVDNCRKTGHSITETRQMQIGGVTLTYQTCKCGAKSRV